MAGASRAVRGEEAPGRVGPCPLCGSKTPRPYARVAGRRYFECDACGLVMLAPWQRLGPAAERAHYATHRNRPDDPRYRAFLGRLARPMVERLAPGACGLDYGSGPGPTLSLMLAEQGFDTAVYDPFFAPDPAALACRYDFITCTETAEHFFRPGAELRRLGALLRPGGWLGIMTALLDEGRLFADWHYIRDPTHVCFYRPRTLAWIASVHGWTLERPGDDVALFRKPGGAVAGGDPPPPDEFGSL